MEDSSDTQEALQAAIEMTAKPKESFQDTIAQTMSKLKDSEQQVKEKVEQDIKIADPMEQMMKELEGLMESGDFDDVFTNLMKELVNKELLFEPMRDLNSKYPEWLEEHKNLDPEERKRYEGQHKVIAEIVSVFEQSGDELTPEENEKVTKLMQDMQAFGNPPEGLLKELAPGVDLGADGLPPIPGMEDGAPPPECKNM
ncbi:Pex19 protein [Gorgonomyces haynaldii]|nr:Pex19 protein [Gorgonomyces haynaldii]